MAPNFNTLVSSAHNVAKSLGQTGRQLVLAESCTAGLVAASLGAVPGISRHLCGSAVVYQGRTKTEWLGVREEQLIDPGAVSPEVARAMAFGVLDRTPQADLAAAITGHLGPDAPPALDGLVYIAIQQRGQPAQIHEHRLECHVAQTRSTMREIRQCEAARLMLESILAALRHSQNAAQ